MKKLFISLFVIAGLAFAGTAYALTVQEVLDLKDAGFTTSEIVAMFGSTGGSSYAYTHTVTLRTGSTGSAVSALQTALNTYGGAALVADGQFGPVTAAAVRAFQASKGLSVDGVVGPNTGGALQAASATTTSGSEEEEEDTELSGGAGSIDYSQVSSLANEEVGEDEEDVEVLGVDLEAQGSDIRLTAVRLDFGQGAGATNDDFEDYADEVSVWLDGEEIGRVDADEFIENNLWADTVSLTGDTIIREDDEMRLTVAVSGASNIDTNDKTDRWTIDITSIRYRDAQAAVISEVPTVTERTFSFEGFATAADVELKVSLEDHSINDAHVIDVDDTDTTDEEPILSFTLEAEGSSDILVDEIPFVLTLVGMNIDDAIPTVYLFADGEQIGSESTTSLTTTETITFEDLDYTIDAGDEIEFIIKVDINDLDATGGAEVAEGDTIQAEITGTETDLIDAEDESGEQLAAGDLTGTAAGEAHAIYDNGIMVELVSVSKERTFIADEALEDDQGEYLITFDVTAFGADMYLDRSTEADGADAPGQGTEYIITSSAGTPVVSSSLLESTSSDGNDNVNVFQIEEDDTRRFTLNMTLTADTTPTPGAHEVSIASLNWGTATDDTNANYYTFNLDDFKTGSLYLNAL